jgi:hypothetical protein
MNPVAQILLKVFFGLWGLLGIVLHLLKAIKDYNTFHPDNPIKTPKQMWAYVISDLPGLSFSVLCYVVIWGIWCSFFQLSKQITGEQFRWLSEALLIVGNPWAGICMVFIGFSSDSVWNKASQKFDQELNKRLGVPSDGQPPLPPPPPPNG